MTPIDFGSWKVSASCKLEELSAGAAEISGFAHKYLFLFSFLNKSANLLRIFHGREFKELFVTCSGQHIGTVKGSLNVSSSCSSGSWSYVLLPILFLL